MAFVPPPPVAKRTHPEDDVPAKSKIVVSELENALRFTHATIDPPVPLNPALLVLMASSTPSNAVAFPFFPIPLLPPMVTHPSAVQSFPFQLRSLSLPADVVVSISQ
jgi:hypothetical protein